jgi:3-hydroxybenzoate 6-monooxygenase
VRTVAPRRHQEPQRNAILRARDTYDYTFTERIYGDTALFPEDAPPMYPTIPLNSVAVADEQAQEPLELVAVE